MKISEIIKHQMPRYKGGPGVFMCNLIEFAREPRVHSKLKDAAQQRIMRDFDNCCSLSSHLKNTSPEYRAAHKAVQENGVYGFESEECHVMRVQWFENLIAELEANNE